LGHSTVFKGLKIFKNCRKTIDAVLLDIIMPKMSGAKVFKQMFEIDPEVKVIITSGHMTNQDQKKCLPNQKHI
jgi:DNA-binding NtrC family response regulator